MISVPSLLPLPSSLPCTYMISPRVSSSHFWLFASRPNFSSFLFADVGMLSRSFFPFRFLSPLPPSFFLPRYLLLLLLLPPASSCPNRYVSFSWLCSFRYLAHPPCDYRNFLGATSRYSVSLLLFDSSEARICERDSIKKFIFRLSERNW